MESADLRQAAHSRVHAWQGSFKKFLEPDGDPEHHQQHFLKTNKWTNAGENITSIIITIDLL